MWPYSWARTAHACSSGNPSKSTTSCMLRDLTLFPALSSHFLVRPLGWNSRVARVWSRFKVGWSASRSGASNVPASRPSALKNAITSLKSCDTTDTQVRTLRATFTVWVWPRSYQFEGLFRHDCSFPALPTHDPPVSVAVSVRLCHNPCAAVAVWDTSFMTGTVGFLVYVSTEFALQNCMTQGAAGVEVIFIARLTVALPALVFYVGFVDEACST
mmetsp:Transcript_12867/g.39574  ORF Transcript_12867/g.39574 Transcript_12867/m.39574 type:complete len:215 (+) Transcript_12867:293-937(+)